MSHCGSLWVIVGHCGSLWVIVGHCGSLWVIVGHCGSLWVIGGHCGALWGIVGNCGSLWVIVGHCGSLWVIVGHCGSLWVIVGHCGSLWVIVGHCGSLWGIVGHCGSLWVIVGDRSVFLSPFFLHILGYKYDTIITKMFREMSPNKMRPESDICGKHKLKHALKEEDFNQIDEHIGSFGPTISHYRRSHAPLRRYLPPELTLIQMYRYYEETYPDTKHNIESYRRRLKLKNISFCKLGEEECEICLEHSHRQCRKIDEEGATENDGSDCPSISLE